MLGASMQLREHVVVAQVPGRARLDQLAAPDAPGETSRHHRLKQRTELPVPTAIPSPRTTIRLKPAALRAIGQHRRALLSESGGNIEGAGGATLTGLKNG